MVLKNENKSSLYFIYLYMKKFRNHETYLNNKTYDEIYEQFCNFNLYFLLKIGYLELSIEISVSCFQGYSYNINDPYK